MKFFVVCPRGLEAPLHAELTNLVNTFTSINVLEEAGLPSEEARALVNNFKAVVLSPVPAKATGGIEVAGPLALSMAINLYSRIASRVLTLLVTAPYRKEDDIYKTARGIAWEDWFDPNQTLRVDLTSHRSPLTSLNYATLKIKDAICDRMRQVQGERPSIDTATPDVRVSAYLDATHVSIYMDTSGEALFKRGWRDEKGAAPLKENLAAGILALTGWKAEQPLFDPMCGSGTFLIEAAQMALQIPPGAIRAGLLDGDGLVDVAAEAEVVSDEVEPIVDVEEDLIDEVEDQQGKQEQASEVPAKPVWQAPISVETGKPIHTGVVNPPIARPVKSMDHEQQRENSSEKPSRRISVYKPTRVDLVTSLQGFGFLRLKPYQQARELKLWKSICHYARLVMEANRGNSLRIAGSDINEKMVAICKSNWKKAKLPGLPIFRQVDALATSSPFKQGLGGVMLFNPPYGERLEIKGGRGGIDGEKSSRGARDPLPKNISDPEFVEFLAQFGRHLKTNFGGWQVDVLTADMGLPGQLRMKESKRTPLFNGAIECRLFRFDIRALDKQNSD